MVLAHLFKTPIALSGRSITVIKACIHLAILIHIFTLFYLGITDNLGADPVKTLLHTSGTWAVHLLLVTLSVSPLAKRLHFPALMRFRRMLGIYSFVYALVHFFSYCVFEIQLDWSLIASEIAKRPYITVGFTALILLLALTLTSPNIVRRRLGPRWQTLHNSIYLIGFLALLHFTWSQKTLLGESLIYWGIFFLLMAFRKNKFIRPRARKRKE